MLNLADGNSRVIYNRKYCVHVIYIIFTFLRRMRVFSQVVFKQIFTLYFVTNSFALLQVSHLLIYVIQRVHVVHYSNPSIDRRLGVALLVRTMLVMVAACIHLRENSCTVLLL